MKKLMFAMMLSGFVFVCADNISGQNCQPNDDQIAIFADRNFKGNCKILDAGEYANPAAMGFDDDSVSSIKVGANVFALLDKNAEFTGEDNIREKFEEDDDFLGDNGIGDDTVSAIEVRVKDNRDDGAVFINRAKVNSCAPEAGWKICVEMASPKIKIFASRLASQSALNGVANTYTEITKRLNAKYPKEKLNGYKIYLTNGEPWSELSAISPVGTLWSDQTGPMSGDFLRGGTTENYLWIDEQMICKTGVKTRNEAGTPDNEKRTLDQVVHEFAHAIDFKYIPDQTINGNFNTISGFPAAERFAASIQNWFDAPAGNLDPNEDAVLNDIFTSRLNLKCNGYTP